MNYHRSDCGESVTDEARSARQLDAAYKPFPTFAVWMSKVTLDTVRWDRYTAAVRERGAVDARGLDRARQIATRTAAIDTGAIENLYEADRRFTYTVAFQTAAWESEMAARGEQVRPLFEAQLHGYELVMTLATGAEPISEAAIRELHVQMCRAQETYSMMTAVGPQQQPLPKGQYKSQPNHVRTRSGEDHSYALVDMTPGEMHRLVQELRGEAFLVAHPVVQAAYAHYCFVLIPPFADGNGRVARALASAFTYRAVSMPIVILTESKATYLDVLEAADAGDYQKLVDFLLKKSMETAELVEEVHRAESDMTVKEMRTILEGLARTGSEITEAMLDEGALRQIKLFQAEMECEAGKLRNSQFAIEIVRLEVRSWRRPGYRGSLKDDCTVTIRVSTPTPHPAAVNETFAVDTPGDSSQSRTLYLGSGPNSIHRFHAEVDDLVPQTKEVVRLRLQLFGDAVMRRAVKELISQKRRLLGLS